MKIIPIEKAPMPVKSQAKNELSPNLASLGGNIINPLPKQFNMTRLTSFIKDLLNTNDFNMYKLCLQWAE